LHKEINIVHYWGGVPTLATSKWHSFLELILKCNQHNWVNWLILSKKPDNLELINPFIEAGCKIIYQPRSRGNFDLRSIYRNFKLFKKIKCDVFHCYNDHTSPLIAAALNNIPVRIWSKLSMSSYYELGIRPKGLQRFMLSTRVTCLLSNRILAISDMAGEEIVDQVGFKKKIFTVNVPVSVERFILAKEEKMREKLSFNKSDIIIVAVGRSIKVKGWDIAIKAFARVMQNISNVKLLLVGDNTSNDYYHYLCTQIAQLNLQDDIIFTGARNDIPEILKTSDIFILPSRSEGTPAALIEAMASGLPCIATKVGGIPEVIRDGENGLLFQREDDQELADKIISIATDERLKECLLNNAMKDLQGFTIEAYVTDVLSHYTALLK